MSDDTPVGELPEGVHHYATAKEAPSEIAKYWHQRYDIFSKFDEGVWLTDDAWFGVTPEPIATKIAEQVARAPANKTCIIDAFAGVGGNTIAFALSGRWKQILAVEKDPAVLACGKHNAELYGVSNKIFWIQGDIFDLLPRRLKHSAKDGVIFASPPWGGPTYGVTPVFDLATMEPYSLKYIHDSLIGSGAEFVLYLPRTSDLNQLAKVAKRDEKLKVVHYCMYGASKALCAYFGSFDAD